MRKYRLLLLGLSIVAPSLLPAEAPIHDGIRLSFAVLLQAEPSLAPPFQGEYSKGSSKGLPSSVAMFLKPSPSIDSRHPLVSRAAREAVHLLGPLATKQVLDDPQLLVEAVKAWEELHISLPDEEHQVRPYSTDLRTLNPKASQLIHQGQADAAGQVRIRIAILRALGVPARACLFRGQEALQYWAAWLLPESGPGKLTGKGKLRHHDSSPRIRGEWRLDEISFPGEAVDAWSLDSGDIAAANWQPQQELACERIFQRAYYALSETAQASADLNAVRDEGRLPAEALRRAEAPRKGPWLLLVNLRCHFDTEGSMEGLHPLELLLPYGPKLQNWGSQLPPNPSSMESLASAFWSDRPDRVHLKKNGEWSDDFKSPPPAYGILHYASVDLRKPDTVLSLERQGSILQGKVLRRDSLAPRVNWTLSLSSLSPSATLGTTQSDAKGVFEFDLNKDEAAMGSLKVVAARDSTGAGIGDSQVLVAEP